MNLVNFCYSYSNCTGLIPQLPATTLTGTYYTYMFNGCSSLTTAPELPATTLTGNCYSNMFNGCSKLNYIKAKFTSYNSKYFTDWVNIKYRYFCL